MSEQEPLSDEGDVQLVKSPNATATIAYCKQQPHNHTYCITHHTVYDAKW